MVAFSFFLIVPTWLAILWRKCLAAKLPKTANAVHSRSIIVFRLDQLGDLVLTTPLFRELKKMYPGSRCTVVVQPQHTAILTTNRNVDEVLPLRELRVAWLPAHARRLASALWLYWTELRQRQFDLAISPRWDTDEGLATFLCVLTNARTRIGHGDGVSSAKSRINRGFAAAFDIVVPPRPPEHEVDRNLSIIKALGGSIEGRQLEIRLTDRDRQFACGLLTHHDGCRLLVALGIGGRAAGRKWPLRNYAESVVRLNQQRAVQPVIVCSGDEDAEALELSVMLPVSPYILSGVPLRGVCAVLERCDLFLGNDTGSAHLAAAMACPTVVISRHPVNGDPNHANSPVRFAPRCSINRVVQPLRGEGTCVASCRSSEAHCIATVTVERVVAAATELLARPAAAQAVRLPPCTHGAVHPVAEFSAVGVAGPS